MDPISFNHECKDLTVDQSNELKNLYQFYHKLKFSYKWRYRRLKTILLALNMASVSLTAAGSMLALFTHNWIGDDS